MFVMEHKQNFLFIALKFMYVASRNWNWSESTDTYIVYNHARRFKNQIGILYTAIKGGHVFAMDRCTLIKK